MVPNTFYPIIDNFASFLFGHHLLFIYTLVYMPDVIMFGLLLVVPYLLGNSFVSVTDENVDLKTRFLQEIK